MTMRRAIILVVGVAVMATGVFAGDGDDANKADLKRLQGKWKIVSRKVDGQSLKPSATWTITGNKILYGGGFYALLTLNAKETPRAFDFDQYDAGGPVTRGGKGFKGIYAFEGEHTMKWCVTELAGSPRPKAFQSKQGDGNILYVLQRVKE
jgi:uncharacterized protein (TIGR03067 family)